MAEESGVPEQPGQTINIQIGGNPATPTEVRELVDGITAKVGEAVQSWQERMKERAAAQSAAPLAPQGAGRS